MARHTAFPSLNSKRTYDLEHCFASFINTKVASKDQIAATSRSPYVIVNAVHSTQCGGSEPAVLSLGCSLEPCEELLKFSIPRLQLKQMHLHLWGWGWSSSCFLSSPGDENGQVTLRTADHGSSTYHVSL